MYPRRGIGPKWARAMLQNQFCQILHPVQFGAVFLEGEFRCERIQQPQKTHLFARSPQLPRHFEGGEGPTGIAGQKIRALWLVAADIG